MQFSDIITMARLVVPGAKSTVVSDSQLKIIINQGCVNIAAIAKCMFRSRKFDITAEKQEYSIAEDVASDYVSMADNGIWLYDGSTWKEVREVTRRWLDIRYRGWRNMSSSFPKFYYVNDNILGFYFKPDTTRSSGGEINYYRKGETMVDDDDVPFHVIGNKKQSIASLEILTDSIFDYVKWKLAEPLSKSTEEIISRERDYHKALQLRINVVKENKGLVSSRYSKRRISRWLRINS